MDAGNITLLSLLDLSAVFDCVYHEILLNWLRITYSLESVINWFAFYLSHRTQSVHHDGRFSARSTMRFGVPQGSVLEPLMFLLYTADIENYITHRGLSPHLYADDTQMFICCRPGNTHLLHDTKLSCISNIEEWMCSNWLKLNPAKTEFLWCATHRRLHLIDESLFIIGNATIKPATSARIFSVLMDRDLSLQSHIARLAGACFKALRQARAIRRSLMMDASRMLISKAVLSRIDYCNCIFAGLPDFHLDRLEQVMRLQRESFPIA